MQHTENVNTNIVQQQQQRDNRRNLVNQAGRDSGFFTYKWNNLFKRYFKVYDPSAFLQG